MEAKPLSLVKAKRDVRLQAVRKFRLANRLALANARPDSHKPVIYKNGYSLIATA